MEEVLREGGRAGGEVVLPSLPDPEKTQAVQVWVEAALALAAKQQQEEEEEGMEDGMEDGMEEEGEGEGEQQPQTRTTISTTTPSFSSSSHTRKRKRALSGAAATTTTTATASDPTPPHSSSLALLLSLGQAAVALTQKLARTLFEWCDGPLVTAMKEGHVVLLDEISLAEDAVLERLNSVLEPGRSLTLAEKGGGKEGGREGGEDGSHLVAAPGFRLLATMNPGGDYGKRELSPALRSRFTEIWVPPLRARADVSAVVLSVLAAPSLPPFLGLASLADPMLDFVDWLRGGGGGGG